MGDNKIRLGVCQNGSCSSVGSTMLLRDIEEYCGKHAEVCASTCLNRCGKGPNVEITADGAVTIVEGVKSFKRMEKMILENVEDCELEGYRRKVAQLKFDSRRQETTEGKLAKIAEAFEALGGEQRAIDKNAKQSSQLLVLRSRALLKSEAEKALADAEVAAKLRASQPQPYLALADALAQLKRPQEAQQAMQQALELTTAAFEKKELQKRLAELEKRAAQAAAASQPPRRSVKDLAAEKDAPKAAADAKAAPPKKAKARQAKAALTEEQASAVEGTWKQAAAALGAETVGVLLFRQIFDIAPEALQLFPFGEDPDLYDNPKLKGHGVKVVTMVDAVIKGVRDLEGLKPTLQDLGLRHVGYGVLPPHYDVVGQALLRTLRLGLQDAFTQGVEAAWTKLWAFVAKWSMAGNYPQLEPGGAGPSKAAKARPAEGAAAEAASPPKEHITMRMWGEDGVKETQPLTEEEQAKTLYARLGGAVPLEKLVFGVYDLMRADTVMSAFFERFAKTPETFLRLKVRTVDYFGGEWGGPAYEGPNLFEAHASMAIDDELYDGMMRCYVEMLQRIDAGPQETKEVLESVEAMRPPIVDPDGIFQAEMEKKLRKAAVQRQERMRLYKEQKKREEEEKKAKAAQKPKAGQEPKPGKAKKEPHRHDAAAGPGAGHAGLGAAEAIGDSSRDSAKSGHRLYACTDPGQQPRPTPGSARRPRRAAPCGSLDAAAAAVMGAGQGRRATAEPVVVPVTAAAAASPAQTPWPGVAAFVALSLALAVGGGRACGFALWPAKRKELPALLAAWAAAAPEGPQSRSMAASPLPEGWRAWALCDPAGLPAGGGVYMVAPPAAAPQLVVLLEPLEAVNVVHFAAASPAAPWPGAGAALQEWFATMLPKRCEVAPHFDISLFGLQPPSQ
ncbi:unnamed protein product [Prorocentrum cordatum]|uniref:Globin domain-containing protein n=1 Tax=Prorocentrum cordatum TaxID=2364126 RepID=A0ABN9TQK4_9DINO|nr:unnamed protein product [Polarella glacialis]